MPFCRGRLLRHAFSRQSPLSWRKRTSGPRNKYLKEPSLPQEHRRRPEKDPASFRRLLRSFGSMLDHRCLFTYSRSSPADKGAIGSFFREWKYAERGPRARVPLDNEGDSEKGLGATIRARADDAACGFRVYPKYMPFAILLSLTRKGRRALRGLSPEIIAA